MTTIRNQARIAKFRSWVEEAKEFPNDYKIEYRGVRNEYARAVYLMRKADDQWYVIESLEDWEFKHETDDRSIIGATTN